MKTQKNVNPENSDTTILKTGLPNEAKKPQAAESSKASWQSHPSLWQSVLVGGVPGILIGALGGATAPELLADVLGNDSEEPVDSEGYTQYDIHQAHSVNDDMSFNEAFAAARREVGPGGAFVWHGRVYGTYRGDDPEWQNMSAEDRTAHSHQILSQVHAGPYTPAENEPSVVPNDANNGGDEIPGAGGNDEVVPPGEEGHGGTEVTIIGVGSVVTEDGSEIEVGYGEVDGVGAAFVDSDGDGTVDTVLLDSDNNGEIDMNEVYNAEESGISVEIQSTEDLMAQADMDPLQAQDDNLYPDMPDYTNDANVDSLT